MLFKGFKNLSLYYLVSALFLTDKCLCLWPLEARSPADIRVPALRDKSRLTMSFSQFFTVVWEAHLGVLHLFLWDLVSLALQPSLKKQKVAMYLSGAFQIEQAFTGLPVFSSISPPPSGLARAARCWFSAGACLFPDDAPCTEWLGVVPSVSYGLISDTLKVSASGSVLMWVSCHPLIHLCPREISLSTETMLGDSKS